MSTTTTGKVGLVATWKAHRALSRYKKFLTVNAGWQSMIDEAKKSKRPTARPNRERSEAVVRAIRAASTYQKDLVNTCLVHSLAAHHLLQQEDVDVKICIGIVKYPQFFSHAWVECEGEPIGEDLEMIKLLTKISEV